MFDDRIAQIGPENLDLHFGRLGSERFQNTNRQGINFFTGRATRDPRAQLRLSILALTFQQAWLRAFPEYKSPGNKLLHRSRNQGPTRATPVVDPCSYFSAGLGGNASSMCGTPLHPGKSGSR